MPIRTFMSKAVLAALASSLVACGGGGGSSAVAPTADATAPVNATQVATDVASLVPGATMTWATADETTLSVTVQGSDGSPAAGAAVRVFTLSRTSPQDGSAPTSPVPVSLLDTAVCDVGGKATLPLRLPAHLGEVLVVTTWGDTHAQGAVGVDGAVSLALVLGR